MCAAKGLFLKMIRSSFAEQCQSPTFMCQQRFEEYNKLDNLVNIVVEGVVFRHRTGIKLVTGQQKYER